MPAKVLQEMKGLRALNLAETLIDEAGFNELAPTLNNMPWESLDLHGNRMDRAALQAQLPHTLFSA